MLNQQFCCNPKIHFYRPTLKLLMPNYLVCLLRLQSISIQQIMMLADLGSENIWTVLKDYEHCSSCSREKYNLSDNIGQNVACAPPHSFYHFKSPFPAVGWTGLAVHEFQPLALWGGASSRCCVAYSCRILMHWQSQAQKRKIVKRINTLFWPRTGHESWLAYSVGGDWCPQCSCDFHGAVVHELKLNGIKHKC